MKLTGYAFRNNVTVHEANFICIFYSCLYFIAAQICNHMVLIAVLSVAYALKLPVKQNSYACAHQ